MVRITSHMTVLKIANSVFWSWLSWSVERWNNMTIHQNYDPLSKNSDLSHQKSDLLFRIPTSYLKVLTYSLKIRTYYLKKKLNISFSYGLFFGHFWCMLFSFFLVVSAGMALKRTTLMTLIRLRIQRTCYGVTASHRHGPSCQCSPSTARTRASRLIYSMRER